MFSEAVFGGIKVSAAGYPTDFEDYALQQGISESELHKLGKLRVEVNAFLDDCLSIVNWDRVKIAAFTTTMLQPLPSLALAKRLKQHYPHLHILFGGSGCHGEMGRALHRNFEFIDGVVDGDGDRNITLIAKGILEGSDQLDISGLIWRSSLGKVTSSAAIPFLDMNDYPTPQFDDFFSQLGIWHSTDLPDSGEMQISNPEVSVTESQAAGAATNTKSNSSLNDEVVCEVGQPAVLADLRIPFEASRGCWWATRHHCKFCGLNGNTLQQRERSVDRVIQELSKHYRHYGPAQYIAADNIISPRHLPALPESFKKSIPDGRLFFEVGAALSRRQLQALAEGGVSDVQPGIESLSTEVLTMVDKGTTSIMNVCFLRRSLELGVTAHWNFLYGLPNEKPDWYSSMLSWVPKVFHLQPPEAVRFSLQRFSPYFENPKKYGIKILGPMPAMRYIWNLPDHELCSISYDLEFQVQGDQHYEQTGSALNSIIGVWLERDAHFTVKMLRTGESRLLDSRFGVERSLILDSYASTILRLLESPTTFLALAQQLRRLSSSTYLRINGQIGVRAIVEHLVADGIVLSQDEKLLALPVPLGEYWIQSVSKTESLVLN